MGFATAQGASLALGFLLLACFLGCPKQDLASHWGKVIFIGQRFWLVQVFLSFCPLFRSRTQISSQFRDRLERAALPPGTGTQSCSAGLRVSMVLTVMNLMVLGSERQCVRHVAMYFSQGS